MTCTPWPIATRLSISRSGFTLPDPGFRVNGVGCRVDRYQVRAHHLVAVGVTRYGDCRPSLSLEQGLLLVSVASSAIVDFCGDGELLRAESTFTW